MTITVHGINHRQPRPLPPRPERPCPPSSRRAPPWPPPSCRRRRAPAVKKSGGNAGRPARRGPDEARTGWGSALAPPPRRDASSEPVRTHPPPRRTGRQLTGRRAAGGNPRPNLRGGRPAGRHPRSSAISPPSCGTWRDRPRAALLRRTPRGGPRGRAGILSTRAGARARRRRTGPPWPCSCRRAPPWRPALRARSSPRPIRHVRPPPPHPPPAPRPPSTPSPVPTKCS